MANSHVLSDRIVQDGLSALVEHLPHSKYYVGGGTAVQMQVPDKYHRSTSDLDTTFGRSMSYNDFKTMLEGVQADLMNKGYASELEKNRQHYDVVYSTPQDTHLIQVSRRSSANFERNTEEIMREIERTRTIQFDGVHTVPVLSPEDIILHKTRRICVFESKYGVSFLKKYGTHEAQHEFLMKERARAERAFDTFSPEEVADMRLQADVFDIGILLDFAPFDDTYFRKHAINQPIFHRDLEKSKKIVRSIDERLEF